MTQPDTPPASIANPANAPFAFAPDEVLNIQVKDTPNPNSLKYILGITLVPGGSANFPTAASAVGRSPLAARIFEIPGIVGVFIGPDFFTITREEGRSWSDFTTPLENALQAFFEAGEPVLMARSDAKAPPLESNTADPALAAKIEELLERKVRPTVAQDGGDIVYRGFAGGVVYLELHGACSSCPSSTATLKIGVETMLRAELPGVVQSVEAM
jgi:Fe-S cluster biogenesis protein NfuA